MDQHTSLQHGRAIGGSNDKVGGIGYRLDVASKNYAEEIEGGTVTYTSEKRSRRHE